jgi:hypothetical protein
MTPDPDRDRFTRPFTHPDSGRPIRRRPRPTLVAVCTLVTAVLTLLAVLTFGLLWLYGGDA